ncbi:hypothetical protein BDZ89DRAFT_1136448 [Hymenopellis radicata]|nr:hypothetical protein BDZ89DRAFT_1136448 [Hymenopellis radicata]
MPSTNGHYDQTLLAEAQAPTRAQLQEGYNADILRPNRTPALNDTSSSGPRSTPASKEHLPIPVTQPPTKQPFWRTRKGMIIIAIAALVIIGAVVGGAVGGTVGKNNNNSSTSSSTAPGPTISNATQGQGVESGNPNGGSATATSAKPAQSSGSADGGSIQGGPP